MEVVLAARTARPWRWILRLVAWATGREGGADRATVRDWRAPGAGPGSGSLDPGDLVAAAYDKYQREIHSFAAHSLRDPEAAADVTQEAFVRLLREAQAGRAPDNIRAWLYRVCTNLLINRTRRARVVDAFRRTWSGGEEIEDSPEWLALRAEQAGELRRALSELSRDARVGLLLSANGFSGKEVAEAIGRSELATRTLLCRARIQLRERLAAAAAQT